MIPRLARLAGRAAIGVAALLVLAAGFLQTPPGRTLQRQFFLSLLRRSGLEARLEAGTVSPWRLEATFSGLELRVPGRPVFLAVGAGRVRLSPETWRGPLAIADLELNGPQLSLERAADGRWNLPESAPGDGAQPLDLRPWLGARIASSGGSLRVRDAAAGFEAEVPQLRFEWSGAEGSGQLAANEGARWRPWAKGGAEAAGPGGDERAAAPWRHVGLEPASLLREGGSVRVQGPVLVAPEGRVAMTGVVEQVEGSPKLRVAADGHADVGRLAGPPWRGRLVLQASAAGPLAALAWEAKARAEGLAVADLDVEAKASAREEKGTWHLQGEGRIAGGRVFASVAVPSTGDARAEAGWDGLDATRLLRPLSPRAAHAVRGRLTGALAASWPSGASDLARLTVEAHNEVAAGGGELLPPVAPPGRDAPAILALAATGRATLRLRDGRYVAEVDHALSDVLSVEGRAFGRLPAKGVAGATLSGTARIALARPSALVRAAGGSLAHPLTGRLETSLTLGGTLESPEAEGPLQARDLGVLTTPALDADARLVFKDGRVALEDIVARGPDVTLEGALSLGPGQRLDGNASAKVSLEQWRRALPEIAAPEGRVEARAVLSGTASAPEIAVDFEGQDVRFFGQLALLEVAGRVRSTASGLEIPFLSLEQEDGRLSASGSWTPNGETWAMRTSARNFGILPIGGAGDGVGVPLTARVDGQAFALRARGTALDAGGTLTLSAMAWNGEPLGAGTLELRAPGGRLDAELRLSELKAVATAHLEPDPSHPLRAELRLDGTSLGTLARALGATGLEGSTSLRARLQAEAQGPPGVRVEGEIVQLDGALHGVRFRLPDPARFVVGRDRIEVAGLELQGDDLRARLTGSLAGEGEEALELRVQGNLGGLDPLWRASGHPTLSASGAVELIARLGGTPTAPLPQATLALTDGSVRRDRDVLLKGLTLRADFGQGTLRLAQLDAEVKGLRLSAIGEAGAGLLTAPGGPAAHWPMAARAALGGEHRARLELRVQSRDDPKVTSGPPVENPPRPSEASPAEAARRTHPLRIEALLETEATGVRSLRGRADVHGLGFTVQGVPLRQEKPFTIDLANGRLTVPEVTWKGGETDLRLRGGILLSEEWARLRESVLDLRAQGVLDLRMLNALARGLEAGGVARLQTDLTGSLAGPSVRGDLRLQDAVVSYRPWRLRIDDLSAALQVHPGRVTVEGLSGTLNGGSLAGGGALELVGGQPRRGEVQLEIAGANVDWPEGARGLLDGTLALRGTEAGPVLAGDLLLADGAYRGDPRTLVAPRAATLGGEEKGPTLLSGLGLDLRLRTEPDVRVDNPFGTFAFSVDLTARGSAAAPRLQGQVALQPNGFVYWSGRKFTVERATLDWKGASGLMPFVQARATTRVSSYDVFADFSGPLNTADARLVSNPPLGSNEITSLLVTGSTTSGAADSRALGIASANLLGNMGRRAGLDTVRIDQGDDQSLLNFDPSRVVGEANPAQRLTITKRLSANLEATVSLNLSESGKTTTFVGWKPRPAFEVRVAQRDDYTGSLEFRHDIAFGGTVAPVARARPRGSSDASEIVTSVEVDDRAQGDPRPLQPRLRLRPGKPFSYDDWQRDRSRIETLVARRGFAEAYVVARREPRRPAPGGGEVALVYVVHRGPRTTLEVRGLDLPPDLVRALGRAWSQGDYETSIESEALSRIRTHLADQGRFTPSLRARVETSPGGDRKTLIVEGEAGPRARERRIVFEGGPGLPRDRLLSLVKGEDLLALAWNEPARLERAVAAEYVAAGFLAAEAKASPPALEEGVAVMKMAIDEGPSFTRGPLALRGCAEVACPEVEAAFGLERGSPYLSADHDAARLRVLALYRRGGWNAAQVRLDGQVRPSSTSVDVTLSVEEGPRQILGEIVEEGGAPGTRRALHPLLRLEPGSPVVLQDWAAARKRVYETGLVRGVSLEPEVASSPAPEAPAPGPGAVEPVVARLTYDEWPALRLRYGLQLVTEKPLTSSEDQAVDLGATAELTRSLLFGRALSTGLSAEARENNWSVRGVLSAPRTFGKAFRSSLYLVREREDFDLNLQLGTLTTPGVADTWQLTVEERFRPTRRVELALSYDIQWVTVGLPSARDRAPLSGRPARLIPTALMDARNNILDPSRGFFSSITYNWGSELLGSEFGFRRLFTQQFLYRPLPGRLVSASAFRYERSSGDRGQAFVTTDRLSFGGPTTIRGYTPPEVELLDLLSAVGATTDLLLLNQELRFPILGDLRGVAFVDYGEMRARLEGLGGSEVRLGTGLGLRYSTPVGVLRFDVGFPLKGDEKKTQFYFGLGQAF